MSFIVPPGGFAGFSQMTAASRRALSTGAPRATGRRKKRRKAKAKAKTARKRKSSGRKLKFGSPAWRKKYARKKKAK